ncbi:MAG: cysteine dioxygenase family protein [Planctomycetes bacterium]|nr:cysteine dioxygenase family protein [Planctomycetota bacterium]
MSTPIPKPGFMPLPKRDGTKSPPAVLLPLFKALDSYNGFIDVKDLEREVAKIRMTTEHLGDAIAIDTGAYVRTLVRETEFYDALVMAWLPGQRSPIHDHAGSACTVRIVSGTARETRYRLRGDGLVSRESTITYLPGQVVSSVDRDIHDLGNAASCPATMKDILVTLHVYSPKLKPTRKYVAANDDAAVA